MILDVGGEVMIEGEVVIKAVTLTFLLPIGVVTGTDDSTGDALL